MPITIIPSGATTLEEARDTLNNNFGETEERLQGLEIETAILDGVGVPSNTLGNIGDYYINSSNYTLWKKNNANVWESKTSLAGTPGPQGERGYVGLNHRTSPSPVWDTNVAYNENDAVRYRGSYWRTKVTHLNGQEPTSDSTYWEVISRGYFFVGAWTSTPSITLRRDDIVTYDGSLYLVLENFSTASGDVTPPNNNTRYALLNQKGDVGPQGAPSTVAGPIGPMGTGIVYKGAWNTPVNTTYAMNDAVIHRGSLWVAKQSINTVSEPSVTNSANWQLAIQGFNPISNNLSATDWNSATAYKQNDLVRHLGSTYRVIADMSANATAPPNNSNFAMFAAKGTDGANGANGADGDDSVVPGPPGPTADYFKWFMSSGVTVPKMGEGYEHVYESRRLTTFSAMSSTAVTATLTITLYRTPSTGPANGAEQAIATLTINSGSATNDANRYVKSTGLAIILNVDDKLRIGIAGTSGTFGAISVKAKAETV